MRGFIGGLLVAIGVLVAGTSGLCTGAIIVMAVPALIQNPVQTLQVSPILLIGIIPFVLGVIMTRVGLKLMRSPPDGG